MKSPISTFEKFGQSITLAHQSMLKISDRDMVITQTNKWSHKDILGHLIDSAINNYGRFMTSYTGDTLIFNGYEQEEWVRVQNYNAMSWEEIIKIWFLLNCHISRLIQNIPQSYLSKKKSNHNLHVVGFREFDKNKPATLEDFIIDYIEHMNHHIRQILSKAQEQ